VRFLVESVAFMRTRILLPDDDGIVGQILAALRASEAQERRRQWNRRVGNVRMAMTHAADTIRCVDVECGAIVPAGFESCKAVLEDVCALTWHAPRGRSGGS
jgi:hypothetical protein